MCVCVYLSLLLIDKYVAIVSASSVHLDIFISSPQNLRNKNEYQRYPLVNLLPSY